MLDAQRHTQTVTHTLRLFLHRLRNEAGIHQAGHNFHAELLDCNDQGERAVFASGVTD